MNKLTTSVFSYLCLFFALFTLVSCNSASNQEQKNRTPNSIAAVAPAGVRTIDPRLDILYMDTARFNKLESKTGNTKKWVLKHNLLGQKLDAFTLSVWAEKNQRFETPPVDLTNWIDSETNLGDTAVLFGDQKLNKSQVRMIRQKIQDSTVLKYIIFVPRIGSKMYRGVAYSTLYYDIYLSATLEEFETNFKSAAFVARKSFDFTNPSPPAATLEDANQ